MPQPTKGDVHVNAPLTNLSIAYMQEAKHFIADKVSPLVPVNKQSDLFYEYSREDFYRDSARKRAPGTESAGSGWNLDSTANYFCDVYALHKDVDDQIRANQDAVLDMDRDAALFLAQQFMIRKDKLWLDSHFATGLWTGSSTGGDITPGTLWSAAGGLPIDDIDAEISAMHGKTGYRPNTLVIGEDVFRGIKNNASVLDRIKYTQTGLVTEDLLAGVFGVDQVVVARSVVNSAAEGAAEDTNFIANPKDALLMYVAPRPSIMQPSASYTFAWTGLMGAGANGVRSKKFRMEHLESDRIENQMAIDTKVTGTILGAYFDGAVS